MTRFALCLAAVSAAHPLAAQIIPADVEADFDRHVKAMEFKVDDFDDATFDSQVAQSVDRSLILADVTTDRHAPVNFAAKATIQTKAVAKTLGIKAGLRAAGLNDGLQMARLAAAMTETLALATPRMPGLADNKRNQKASSILFQELMTTIDSSRPHIPSMSDADLLALSQRSFEAKSAKISREVKA